MGPHFANHSKLRPTSPAKGSGGGEATASPAPRRLDLPPDNVVSLADAREAADNGKGELLSMWACALAARPPLEDLDPELARLGSIDAAAIREKAIGAMRLFDANREQQGASELHLLFGEVAAKVDEIAAVLRREVGE